MRRKELRKGNKRKKGMEGGWEEGDRWINGGKCRNM